MAEKYTNSAIVRANLAAILSIPRAELPDPVSGIYPFMTAENTGVIYLFDPDSTAIGFLPTGSSSAGRWIPINREVLQANRTYFVRTDGNDANTGLANNSGGAFLTIQKAIDVAASLDMGVFNVTIQVANGTYNQALTLKSFLGSGTIFITGDTTTPSNVTITSPTFPTITSATQSLYDIKGFTINCSDGSFKIAISSENGNVRFGNAVFPDFGGNGYHLNANGNAAKIEASANYTIAGGAIIHAIANNGAFISVRSRTVTLTGTPNFSFQFVRATVTGLIDFVLNTYSGSATGTQYGAALNGVVFTNGASLPGNSGGTTATGGQYS